MKPIFVNIHIYRYNIDKPEEKQKYDRLVKKLESRGLKLFASLVTDYRKNSIFRQNLQQYETLEIDTKYLFENQYNTTETSGNFRIFEWSESIFYNRDIKEGYYLDIPHELRELQANTYKCGFCGKQEVNPDYDMCPHCKHSKWLEPNKNHLRKMKPIRPLTEGK